MGCQTTMPMTEFDIITTDDTTQMMKAIIPYIDFPLQKYGHNDKNQRTSGYHTLLQQQPVHISQQSLVRKQ